MSEDATGGAELMLWPFTAMCTKSQHAGVKKMRKRGGAGRSREEETIETI